MVLVYTLSFDLNCCLNVFLSCYSANSWFILLLFVSKTIENWLVRFFLLNFLVLVIFGWWMVANEKFSRRCEWWTCTRIRGWHVKWMVLNNSECGLMSIMSSPIMQGTKTREWDWKPQKWRFYEVNPNIIAQEHLVISFDLGF